MAHCKYLLPTLTETFPPASGLGDGIATALNSVGITKERWSKLTKLWRKENPEQCGGCNWRHSAANAVGESLGFAAGKGPALQQLIDLEKIKPQAVNGCEVHGKCLPQLRLASEAKEVVESAGYKLCHGCGDFATSALSSL